jgi:hypothetical protein
MRFASYMRLHALDMPSHPHNTHDNSIFDETYHRLSSAATGNAQILLLTRFRTLIAPFRARMTCDRHATQHWYCHLIEVHTAINSKLPENHIQRHEATNKLTSEDTS